MKAPDEMPDTETADLSMFKPAPNSSNAGAAAPTVEVPRAKSVAAASSHLLDFVRNDDIGVFLAIHVKLGAKPQAAPQTGSGARAFSQIPYINQG
jgi:hypothetical protein